MLLRTNRAFHFRVLAVESSRPNLLPDGLCDPAHLGDRLRDFRSDHLGWVSLLLSPGQVSRFVSIGRSPLHLGVSDDFNLTVLFLAGEVRRPTAGTGIFVRDFQSKDPQAACLGGTLERNQLGRFRLGSNERPGTGGQFWLLHLSTNTCVFGRHHSG